MERLELLGDSVLKYTVGCHLFLKYPEKHDGQLSSLRQSVICNANLHRLGIDRNLQVVIHIYANKTCIHLIGHFVIMSMVSYLIGICT